MPIYEYKCSDCGRSFERLVRSRDVVIRCPNCSGINVGRILSTFSVSSGAQGSATSLRGSRSGCGSCSAGSCAACN